MEWLGLIAFVLVMFHSSYPSKTEKLISKVNKLERKQRGGSYMSKLISEIIGKECQISLSAHSEWTDIRKYQCYVLDADDDWIKIRLKDKKKGEIIKLIRIEDIDNVEVSEYKEEI